MKAKVLLVSTLFIFANVHADTSPKCPGEEGYFYTNHRNTSNPVAGGFVSHTATVADAISIVIGKLAAVCGNAMIFDSANISGNAIVRGDAEVSGSAIIAGDVILEGDVKVTGKSIIKGVGILRTGTYTDIQKTLNEPLPSTDTPLSAPALATKIQEFVQKNAAEMKPASGSWYRGETTVTQKIDFEGACNIVFKKSRTCPLKNDPSAQCSSFHGHEIVKFSMKNFESPDTDMRTYFVNPELSVLNLEMKDYKTKVIRYYKPHLSSGYDWQDYRPNIWYNRFDIASKVGQDPFDSIETKTLSDANILKDLFTKLYQACK